MGSRAFSVQNAADAKVLYASHSPSCFEFQLNHNKTLNSIDMDMVELVIDKLKAWDKGMEKAPRVAMISGTGGKAFCAGGDIVSVYKGKMGDGDPSVMQQFFGREYIMDYSLTQMSPLQIAIWNGIVMGGGVGISCHSPIRIATDNTMYAMPETAIGFFCDVGGSYFLSRVKGNISLGLYLGLTGHRLKAKDLVTWGVATHFVPADQIDNLKEDLALVKMEQTNQEIEAIVAKHAAQASGTIEDLDAINEIFKPDSVQQIVNRLENSDTEFSKGALKKIKNMSPLSLGIVFEQIKRGKSMNLHDVFEMEYKMSQAFMEHREFFEGVRALLVDKDKNPQWSHKSVHDVTQAEVDSFFKHSATIDLNIANA